MANDQVMKRLRMATQRHPGQAGLKKRRSIFKRQAKNGGADLEHTGENFGGTMATQQADEDGEPTPSRRIYINQAIPADELDEDGNPIAQYARNKIRTSKYTPLSFVPKNLWLQFHNVANIFFLFVAILAVSSQNCSDFDLCAQISD